MSTCVEVSTVYQINHLFANRHRQIAKWLREHYPHIAHFFYVWHVAKGRQFAKTPFPRVNLSMYSLLAEFG